MQSFITRLNEILSDDSGNKIGSSALAAAVAERDKQRKEQISGRLVTLLEQGENLLSNRVDELRRIRRMEKQREASVKSADRALRYFMETGNPLPLLREGGLSAYIPGIELPEYESDEWLVPADWKPAENAE